MMTLRRSILVFLALLIGLAVAVGQTAGRSTPDSGSFAIRNAKIVPVSAPVIEKGTILIKDGKIVDLGVTVSIPSGTKIIDGTGLSVYPGLIDSGTSMGLVEIESVPGTVDTAELGDFNPNAKALTAVNPGSEHISVARLNGITTVVTEPQGGLISGQAALINLDGWTPKEMAIRPSLAMVVNFPTLGFGRGGGFGGGGNFGGGDQARQARDKRIEDLKKKFDDALAYMKAREAEAANPSLPKRTTDLGLEAMIPVLRGDLPVLATANTEKEIKGMIEIADKYKLKLIINGGADAIKVASLLKEKNIPVILPPVFGLPKTDDSPYDESYARPGQLFTAGVRFAFQTANNNPSGPGDIRSLPYTAGTAAAFGLPKEEALKGVTLYPAQIFGVDKLIGSLEKGKIANLIVTDGDPLEFRTRVKQVFINGRPVEMTSKHVKLYEKYKDRQ